MKILCCGAELVLSEEERNLSDEERCIMINLLLTQEKLEMLHRNERRNQGIEQAKQQGKYTVPEEWWIFLYFRRNILYYH